MVRLESALNQIRNAKKRISIPKWYDWSHKPKHKLELISIFQFLNGTIGVEKWAIECKRVLAFQFLNGTIGVLQRHFQIPVRYRISIPKWYDWSYFIFAYF